MSTESEYKKRAESVEMSSGDDYEANWAVLRYNDVGRVTIHSTSSSMPMIDYDA